jgi:hypothetical protein
MVLKFFSSKDTKAGRYHLPNCIKLKLAAHLANRSKIINVNGLGFFGIREMTVALRLFSNIPLA